LLIEFFFRGAPREWKTDQQRPSKGPAIASTSLL
jgi:hypothetical protein